MISATTAGRSAGAVMLATVLLTRIASAQTLGQAQDPHVSYWRVLGATTFCLVLAGAGAITLRWKGAHTGEKGLFAHTPWAGALLAKTGASPRRVKIIETVRPSPTLQICLLQLDGQDYLIASSPQAIVLLNDHGSASRGESV